MVGRTSSRRRRQRSTKPAEQAIERLETRSLLAAAIPAIQIDGQAPSALPEFNGNELIFSQDADSTRLFTTDGTQAGTVQIADIPGHFSEADVVGVMDRVMFIRVADQGTLWATDGTAADTVKIADVHLPEKFLDSAVFAGEFYFSASNGTDGFELWKSNGQASGTVQVKDLNTGQQGPDGHVFYWEPLTDAVSYDVKLEYNIWDVPAGNPEIRGRVTEFEGTTAATSLAVDVDQHAYILSTRATFSGGSKGEWREDFVNVFSRIDTTSSFPSDFAVFNDKLYFAAETPDTGRELWMTDGTENGTTLANDVLPGPASSHPARLLEYDGDLFFGSLATDDLHRLDGNTNTVSVALRGTGDSHGSAETDAFSQATKYRARDVVGSFPIAVVNGHLIAQQMGNASGTGPRRLVSFDSADDATPTDLGVEGSSGVNIPYFYSYVEFFDGFTMLGDRLLFRQSSHLSPTVSEPRSSTGHLWSTDGTTAIRLFDEQHFADTTEITESFGNIVDGQLYYTFGLNHPIFSFPFFSGTARTDGTVAGSSLLSEQQSGGPGPLNQYVTVGDTVYYAKAQNPNEVINHFWDLYQVNPSGPDTLLVTGLEDPRLFGFMDELTMEMPLGEGTAWFKLSEDGLRPAITVTSGVGNQTTAIPTLGWNNAGVDVTHYELYINPAGDRGTASYRQNSLTGTSHTLETPLANGDYEVWLRAHFSDGTKTRWGADGVSMNVTKAVFTTLPPEITAPIRSETAIRPTFSWTPVSGATSYELWVSSDNDVTPIIHKTNLTGTTYTPQSDLTAGMKRMWVRAFNGGQKGNWTSTYRFEILHPKISITGGVGQQSSLTPTLTWQTPANVLRYDLYINVTNNSAAVYRRTDLTSGTHTLETPLDSTQSYDVWLRAFFTDGLRSRWSRSDAPLTVGVAPTFGDTVPQLSVSNDVASWPAIETAVRYELWINQVNAAGQLVQARVIHETNLTALSRDLNLSAGNYRAWIRAFSDDGGVTRWSSRVNFSVAKATSDFEREQRLASTLGTTLVLLEDELRDETLPIEPAHSKEAAPDVRQPSGIPAPQQHTDEPAPLDDRVFNDQAILAALAEFAVDGFDAVAG